MSATTQTTPCVNPICHENLPFRADGLRCGKAIAVCAPKEGHSSLLCTFFLFVFLGIGAQGRDLAVTRHYYSPEIDSW